MGLTNLECVFLGNNQIITTEPSQLKLVCSYIEISMKNFFFQYCNWDRFHTIFSTQTVMKMYENKVCILIFFCILRKFYFFGFNRSIFVFFSRKFFFKQMELLKYC